MVHNQSKSNPVSSKARRKRGKIWTREKSEFLAKLIEKYWNDLGFGDRMLRSNTERLKRNKVILNSTIRIVARMEVLGNRISNEV